MDSRYIRTIRTQRVRRKRVLKYHGAFEDRSKWFKCWVCGFMNNQDRLDGDGYGNVGIDFSVLSDPRFPLDGNTSIFSVLETPESISTVIKLGPDNQPITVYYTERNVVNNKGCPFCGSTNIY